MIIWIFIFVLTLFLYVNKNKRVNRLGFKIVFFFMFVLSMLRGENVGLDTQNYIDIFESGYRLAAYYRNFIFSGLGLLIYNNNGGYFLFQAVISALTFIPWYFLLYKKSENVALSLLLFVFATNRYYFETFNMMRQAAATPYLLWCWVMISEKKYWKSLLFYIIALGFHSSSLIYLPIVFVAYRWVFSNNKIVIVQVLTLIFAFLFSNMTIITNLLSIVLPVDIQELFGMEHYSDYRIELARSVFGLLPMLLPNAFITFYYYKSNSKNLLMRFFVYGSIFLNLISVYPMSYRIAYGLIALEVLIFPILLKQTPNNAMIKLVLLCIVIFSLFDFISSCDIAKLVPYNSFAF